MEIFFQFTVVLTFQKCLFFMVALLSGENILLPFPPCLPHTKQIALHELHMRNKVKNKFNSSTFLFHITWCELETALLFDKGMESQKPPLLLYRFQV